MMPGPRPPRRAPPQPLLWLLQAAALLSAALASGGAPYQVGLYPIVTLQYISTALYTMQVSLSYLVAVFYKSGNRIYPYYQAVPYFDGTYVVVEAENFTVAPGGGWSPKARPAMRSEVIFIPPCLLSMENHYCNTQERLCGRE